METDIVEEFIQRRFPMDCNWMNGNCYWFAKILNTRFPWLTIYYEPNMGHFVVSNLWFYYDFEGKHLITDEIRKNLYAFDQIKEDDSVWYERLVRDCVN